MKYTRLRIIVVAACCVALASVVADAGPQIPPEDLDKAKRMFLDGQEAYLAGDYERAANLFQATYEAWKSKEFLFSAAQAYRKAGRHKDAIRAYETYLEMNPKPDMHVYFGLGACHHALGNTEKAKQWFRKYADMPENEDRKKQLERSAETGEPPGYLTRDDSENLSTAKKLYKEGEELYLQHKWPEAHSRFQKAYELTGYPELIFNAAKCLAYSGDHAEAERQYVRYLKTPDPKPWAWIDLGDVRVWMDNQDGADAAYSQYLKLQPKGKHADRARGSLRSTES